MYTAHAHTGAHTRVQAVCVLLHHTPPSPKRCLTPLPTSTTRGRNGARTTRRVHTCKEHGLQGAKEFSLLPKHLIQSEERREGGEGGGGEREQNRKSGMYVEHTQGVNGE